MISGHFTHRIYSIYTKPKDLTRSRFGWHHKKLWHQHRKLVLSLWFCLTNSETELRDRAHSRPKEKAVFSWRSTQSWKIMTALIVPTLEMGVFSLWWWGIQAQVLSYSFLWLHETSSINSVQYYCKNHCWGLDSPNLGGIQLKAKALFWQWVLSAGFCWSTGN